MTRFTTRTLGIVCFGLEISNNITVGITFNESRKESLTINSHDSLHNRCWNNLHTTILNSI